jgi:hypothetical protein
MRCAGRVQIIVLRAASCGRLSKSARAANRITGLTSIDIAASGAATAMRESRSSDFFLARLAIEAGIRDEIDSRQLFPSPRCVKSVKSVDQVLDIVAWYVK